MPYFLKFPHLRSELEMIKIKPVAYAKYPRNLVDLYRIVERVIGRCKCFNVHEADEITQQICLHACAEMGGKSLIFPAGRDAVNAVRDIYMWQKFTGSNYMELAEKHKMSEDRVRQILSKQRRLQADDNQSAVLH